MIAVVALVVGWAAAPASAGVTASYDPATGLSVQGTDGPESALVSATVAGANGSFVVYDVTTDASTVTAGAGCTRSTVEFQGSAGQARPVVECPIAQPPSAARLSVNASLGGGDDFFGPNTFFINGAGATQPTNVYDGGPGNDEISALNGADTVRGGDGDDKLSGGANDDRLEGGPGNDRFNPGPGTNTVLGEAGDDRLDGVGPFTGGTNTTGADTFSGGSGVDTIGYADRTVSVKVGAGADGQTGENDQIADDVEKLVGGSGGDTLALAAPNGGSVSGGPGADGISSTTAGAVTLDGGPGGDTISGGKGDDTLLARDGIGEKLTCADGKDSLDADLKDAKPSDCESVTQGAIKEGPNVRIATARAKPGRDGRVAVTLRCPAKLGSMGCTGSLKVGAGARTTYVIRTGRSGTVSAALAAKEARKGRVVRAVSVEKGRFGDKTTIAPLTVG